MKRTFDFRYIFNATDFKICFDYEITKTDIENRIKDYINYYNLFKEDNFLISFTKDLEIEFNIVDISDGEYSIEIDNIFINE